MSPALRGLLRRRLLLGGGLALAGGRLVQGRAAWAGQTLRLVVGAAEGGAADVRARAFAPFLERHLPHTRLRVENHPGGAGLAALQAVADAAPGSALAWIGTPSLPARSIDCAGVAPVARRLLLVGAVQQEKVVLLAPAGEAATLPGIVRRCAADGAAQALGTPAPGSAPHLAALQLQASSGTRLNIVAFPSAAAARQAVLAGNLAAAVLSLGEARGATPDDAMAVVELASVEPGWHERGELALAGLIHRGVAVHGRTEPAAIARLRAALAELVGDPEFLDQAASDGFAAQFLDGPAWTARTEAAQVALARLWLATPWRGLGIG